MALAPAPPWTENRAEAGRLAPLGLRELAANRELVLFLALKDLKLGYKQTVLGVGWAVVQPLVGAAVVALFFGRLAHLPSAGLPYLLFVYASSLVHGGWRYVYALNPMVAVADGFRWAALGTSAPGPEHLVSLAVGLVVLVGGLCYVAAADRSFA